jgi:hypothetical protein
MWKLTQLIVLSLFIVSCSNDDTFEINTISDFETYLNQNNYYQESILDESQTFVFSNGSFTKKYKNKRTGQERFFSGSYKVLNGNYSDNGKQFMYVRMVCNPQFSNEFGYFNLKHLVLCEGGNLCPPKLDGSSEFYEDEYGLKIKEYMVSLWCDEEDFSYYPIQK